MNVNLNLVSCLLLLHREFQCSCFCTDNSRNHCIAPRFRLSFFSSEYEIAKLGLKARLTNKSKTLMRTFYSLYSIFPPFLPALLLILTYTFGLLIYLANIKEESQVSLIKKHIAVIISVIQSRNETIRLLCQILSV